MIKQFIRLFCFYILFISCRQNTSIRSGDKNNIIISIQPFSGIPTAEKEYVFNELKKIYPFVEIKENIDLPLLAYNAIRNRYRADSLINFLHNGVATDHIIIGLTNRDISTTKDNVADWGVMGLGFCPGNACVASGFRLSAYDKSNQLFKVAIHELGHTFGLPHCSVSTCFMHDAEGKNRSNEENEFCGKCKSYLISKGWKFSTKN
jgi:archaemetzincin